MAFDDGLAKGLKGQGLCREKYWSEITDAERIERMRAILKHTERRCEELHDALYRAMAVITTHQHGCDGKPMVSADSVLNLNNPIGYGTPSPRRLGDGNTPDEVYF
jgi:hypothetical protein